MKAFRISSIFTASIVALTFVAAASVAQADTLTVFGTPAENDSTPITSTTKISLAEFNNVTGLYAGDRLTSVEIILSGAGSTSYTAELIGNTGSATINSFSTNATLTLSSVPSVTMNLTGTDTLSTPITLTPGNPSTTTTPQSILGATTDGFFGTAGFAGIGDLGFTLTGNANTSYSGSVTDGDLVAVGGNTFAGATVEAIYTYSTPPPVPEPGTLLLFGTGLLGLAGLVRRKFQQSR